MSLPAKVGRPSQWTERKLDAAFLLACLGATEQQMGNIMEVPVSTIRWWKRERPEFKKAIDDGTLGLLSKVSQAFIKRCLGYTYEEEIVTYDRSAKMYVRTTKQTHVPPDPWSCARLLEIKGRNYSWSVTQNININQTNTNINIDFASLTTEQLAVLEQVSLKQLPYNAGNDNP
jgi:hypothetical protein